MPSTQIPSFADLVANYDSTGNGLSIFNRRATQMSKMQSSFMTASQNSIVDQVAKHKALALITSANGQAGRFTILHHLTTLTSAGSGGIKTKPTVFGGVNFTGDQLGVLKAETLGWPALWKASTVTQVPALTDIFKSVVDPEAPYQSEPKTTRLASFMALNGRALQAVEEQMKFHEEEFSYECLLAALVSRASEDLRDDLETRRP